MAETDLFDIPVYWCDENTFWKSYEAALANRLALFEQQSGYPLSESMRLGMTERFRRQYIAPWRFNQVIGWLVIYTLGTQLRGEIWYMSAKRAGRTLVRKHFTDHGKAFELPTFASQTSREIYEELVHEVRSFRKYRGRAHVLDTRQFESIGPFVDWSKLLHVRTA